MDFRKLLNQQLLIIENLDILPSGKVRFGGKAGGYVDVEIESPIGKRRSVRARCGSDCPPGKVQLVKLDTGEYVAFSPSAARPQEVKSVERSSSKKGKLVKKKDEEIWPCTGASLHSQLEELQEDFTDNMATDLTSWDAWQSAYVTGSPTNERVVLFTQRSDPEGDYETEIDALNNNLKENRKLKPGNTGAGSGGAADNAAWNSGSPDAVIIWYYIGNPSDILPSGKIFKVTGPPTHPAAGNITNGGPGLVMQVYGSGIASAIFPNEAIGAGPLTKKIKENFPDLGGKIGYAGRVARWRGQQDYSATTGVYYFRNTPSASETPQTPVSFPPSYVPGQSPDPWLATNANWFQFGWPEPQYIGCASSSWVNANTSALSGIACGDPIPNNQWYWGGDATPNYGRIDKDNPQGYIGTTGVFTCWQGHKDNAGLAMSFFEAFRTYWGISGSVTILGSANPFGCVVGSPSNGSYPSPPAGLRRFIVKQFGRKAAIWLTVWQRNLPPIKLKLPFRFAALIEKFVIQGAPQLNIFQGQTSQNVFLTLGGSYGAGFCFALECPHATMSIDGKFIYVDILFGGKRRWETPLSKPIPCKLSNLGSGDFTGYTWYRQLGAKENGYTYIVGQYTSPGTVEIAPRYKADYFAYCQSYKITLPTSETNRSLTIIESQLYKEGESILLTKASQDNEFNDKFLIFDFRTDKIEDLQAPPGTGNPTNSFAGWQSPNPEYASFGGLPALLQSVSVSIPSLAYFNAIEKFYKPQNIWTDMDKIYFELLESPEPFYPLNTILPSGEFVAPYTNSRHHIRFMLDGKFGRGSRASSINYPSAFGDASYAAPTYSDYSDYGKFLLFTMFKEQLIGNGVKNAAGLITNWFRPTDSSFPIFGQLPRSFYK